MLTAKNPKTNHLENTSEREYWRNYYSAELLTWIDARRQRLRIPSDGIELNVELYEQASPTAPVFVFNHGGGGYSGLFARLARELFERGYTVALPDQRGQGFSAGDRSDFIIPELVVDITNVFDVLRTRYSGPIVLAGGSFGGALTYMAGAVLQRRGATQPAALVCHNLYDLGLPADALGLSRMAPLGRLPGFAALASSITALAARAAPGLRLPFHWLGDFRAMVDESAGEFFSLWRKDPQPIRRVSLRYLNSVFSSPPAAPFEKNTLPILVLNPLRDRMTAPQITERNWRRLQKGAGLCEYATLDCGHWSLDPSITRQWAAIAHDFLTRNRLIER